MRIIINKSVILTIMQPHVQSSTLILEISLNIRAARFNPPPALLFERHTARRNGINVATELKMRLETRNWTILAGQTMRRAKRGIMLLVHSRARLPLG